MGSMALEWSKTRLKPGEKAYTDIDDPVLAQAAAEGRVTYEEPPPQLIAPHTYHQRVIMYVDGKPYGALEYSYVVGSWWQLALGRLRRRISSWRNGEMAK